MSVSNINNNSAAQLQLYAQEKSAAVQSQQNTQSTQEVATSNADSVQISEQAKALLQQETADNAPGNGGGIIPPGNAPVTTLGNGGGIIPPGNAPIGTLGNGGGIIPPGNAPVTDDGSTDANALGNGGGIIPPGN